MQNTATLPANGEHEVVACKHHVIYTKTVRLQRSLHPRAAGVNVCKTPAEFLSLVDGVWANALFANIRVSSYTGELPEVFNEETAFKG